MNKNIYTLKDMSLTNLQVKVLLIIIKRLNQCLSRFDYILQHPDAIVMFMALFWN